MFKPKVDLNLLFVNLNVMTPRKHVY